MLEIDPFAAEHARRTSVSASMDPRATAAALSCVICAFNEAPRIGAVLGIAARHPLIGEVIVVDDGSIDDTAERVREFENVVLLRNSVNRGKSWALARGLERARFNHVMLLDADLYGLRARHLDALAQPVVAGAADVTISMRGDSYYRLLGVDFVSGERVLPRALLTGVLDQLARRTRWGAEIFINEQIIDKCLRVEVVDWRDVSHVAKPNKAGPLRGLLSDFSMAHEILRELGAAGVLRQNLALRNGRHRAQSVSARLNQDPVRPPGTPSRLADLPRTADGASGPPPCI